MCFPTVDELKHIMALAKLQVPTHRRKAEEHTAKEDTNEESVKELGDGSLQVTKVEFKPTSCGRERFGQGTKEWPRFPLETEPIKRFYT